MKKYALTQLELAVWALSHVLNKVLFSFCHPNRMTDLITDHSSREISFWITKPQSWLDWHQFRKQSSIKKNSKSLNLFSWPFVDVHNVWHFNILVLKTEKLEKASTCQCKVGKKEKTKREKKPKKHKPERDRKHPHNCWGAWFQLFLNIKCHFIKQFSLPLFIQM